MLIMINLMTQPSTDWLTAEQAASRLGVRTETLYAYVSRGLLDRTQRPGDRRSLFRADAIEQLARRGRPRVATARAEPIDVPIRTEITAIDSDVLRFRGIDATELSTAGFESVLGLLWTGEVGKVALDWGEPATVVPPGSPSVFDRLVVATVWSAAGDPARYGHDAATVVRAGRRLIPALLSAVGGDAGPGRRIVASRLTEALLPKRRGDVIGLVDAALALLADHELATSTMAVRVAASTRADPYQCVLAGMAALSGPYHGSASVAAHELVERAIELGAEVAFRDALRTSRLIPGFGHVLYRGIDPRARVLLDRWRTIAPVGAVAQVDALCALVDDHARIKPNVDFALGAISATLGGRAEFGEQLFVVARTGGWLAHVIEEYGEPALRFRPRRSIR